MKKKTGQTRRGIWVRSTHLNRNPNPPKRISQRLPHIQVIPSRTAQIGGKLGGWDVQPKGIPLVQPGERYILFLRQDCGRAAWDKSGLPRYSVLGAWAGLAKIVDGQIQFLPKASPALHESDGMSVASFKADLEARIGKLHGNVLVITAMERKPCPARQ